MRVALFPSLYAPHVGGVEELTRRLAEEYLGRGDAVEVWTVRHPEVLAPFERVEGVVVRRFPLPLPQADPAAAARSVPGAVAGLRGLLAAASAFRPDVVHVQCFSNNGVYASALCALRRIPLVVTMQGEAVMDDDDIYDHSALLRTALRLGLRQAAAVTGCSQFVVDDARRRFGLPQGKGVAVFNGVRFDGDAVAAPAPDRGRYVLGLGRVVEKKGFDLLIEAFAAVADRHPDVELVVAGDGAARQDLEDLAGRLGLGARVRFPGRAGRSEVAALMAGAEVFVLPSRVEPFGIVVLEAMRAGRPVVVSSRGGAPEIARHGREGLVVDPTDRAGMAAAIGRLLDDRDLARRLGDAGRQRAESFDWGGIAEQYRALYAQAGARASAGRSLR